jgi:hypothetical protein
MNAPNPDAKAKGRLFDLRWLLAGVLGVYGVILVAIGLTDGAEELAKADGLPINTIVGAIMLVTAIAFGLWEVFESRGGRAGPPEH